MANDHEDLRLNTLHRFTKHSERLVLEEYSHCEVPAGCGGVVLRWRDPSTGLPLSVLFISLGRSELWVDGQLSASSRVDLTPGAHTLALRVTQLPDQPSPAVLLVRHGAPSADRGPLLVSRDDGALRVVDSAAPTPPAEPGRPLAAFHGDPAEVAGSRRWWFDHNREGCTLLELPPRGPLWVLRSVEVDARGGIT